MLSESWTGPRLTRTPVVLIPLRVASSYVRLRFQKVDCVLARHAFDAASGDADADADSLSRFSATVLVAVRVASARLRIYLQRQLVIVDRPFRVC